MVIKQNYGVLRFLGLRYTLNFLPHGHVVGKHEIDQLYFNRRLSQNCCLFNAQLHSMYNSSQFDCFSNDISFVTINTLFNFGKTIYYTV